MNKMNIKKRFSKLAAAALTVVMVLTLIPGGFVAPQTVRAATYTVTSTADANTEGTLRWAIAQVNAGSGGDIINIDQSIASQTITLTSNLPQITKAFTINGNGVTISGDDDYRIFDIYEADATIHRITFANGYISSVNGGAIMNRNGNLTVTDCVFKNNTALYGSGRGGAVYTAHNGTTTTATFVNCLFTGNKAFGGGGAVFYYNGDGDGIMFVNCTFTGDNTSADDESVFFFWKTASGTATPPQFLNCIIANAPSGSIFAGLGGATINDMIFKNTLTNSASLGNNSTNANNQFNIADSGINADGTLKPGSPAIDAGDNSFFPNADTATDLAGRPRILNGIIDMGAYEGLPPDDDTPPTVVTVTPSGNDAAISGNVVITFNETMDVTPGTVQLNNLSALTGGMWSYGGTVFTIPYGGLDHETTFTINISGFKDAAGNVMSAVTSGYTFTTREAYVPQVYDVTSDADDGSDGTLRWAIDQVRASEGGDIINIDTSLEGETITLTSELPQINRAVTINGNGITISGNNTYRIFYIDRVSVTMNDIIFADGRTSSSGGAVYSYHTNQTSTVTFANCLFTGNTARYGGAVSHADEENFSDGSGITFINCTFANDNTATENGNIFSYGKGKISSGGTMPQFFNCILANNDNNKDFISIESNSYYQQTIDDLIFKNTLTNAASLGDNDDSTDNILSTANLGLNADGTLMLSSPAINAGDGSLFPNAANSTDLAGNPRIGGDSIDIGAYEYYDAMPIKILRPETTVSDLTDEYGAGTTVIDRQNETLTSEDCVGTGAVITLPNRSKRAVIVYGDLIGNGSVLTDSVVALARHIAGLESLDGDALLLEAADVNGDGRINIADLIRLARYIAKIDTSNLGGF